MNKTPIHTTCLSAALILFLAEIIHAASTEDLITNGKANGAIPVLSGIADEIEGLYATNRADYFKQHEQLESVLEKLAVTNTTAMKELKRQIQQGLQKECPQTNPELAMVCLNAKGLIANRLMRILKLTDDSEIAGNLAGFLGEIRTMAIHDYKRHEASDNVAPPIQSGGPLNAGMAPEAIADPKARAAYEKAIAENNRHISENKLQCDVLPRLNHEMTVYFTNYCKKLFIANSISNNRAVRLGLERTARLSDEEIRAIEQ
jgi:hypothetical protein